jgi:hypothetical protein
MEVRAHNVDSSPSFYRSYQRSCGRRTIRSDGEARIIAAGFFYSLAANEDLKPDEC